MEPLSWEVTFIQVETATHRDAAARLREQLTPALADTGDVVVDLRTASLDRLGLSALLAVQRQLELNGRRLLVVASDPDFLSLVERAGVGHSLCIFAEPEAAVSHVYDGSRATVAV